MFNLNQILEAFANNGARRVFYKKLATNDNSKNQPYFGSGWDIVSVLPLGQISEYPGDARPNFKCSLNLYWLNQDGELCIAPQSKLILYEKYPEVRLSGFIRGCSDKERLGRLMNPPRDNTPQRILVLGTTRDNRILAYVRESSQSLENQLEDLSLENYGALTEIEIDNGIASIEQLKTKISEIRDRGWRRAKYLVENEGVLESRLIGNHNNSHGMTLEAELGLPHNSSNKPDWRGWEFKSKKISNESEALYAKPVTLFTPAPDGGLYNVDFEIFINSYGRENSKIPGRIDFTGRHYFNTICSGTQLTLKVNGYENGIIQPGGSIMLLDLGDNIVASWSFSRLLNMWNNKHQRFVIVPSRVKNINGQTYCKYFGPIGYGIGTEFPFFLNSFIGQFIYFDPACRIPRKERHQFRISSSNLDSLYNQYVDNVEI